MSDNKHDIPHKPSAMEGSEGATAPELVLEQQIIQLKKQHQLQHQILLQHFQAQQQHLAEQHEQQLRQHLKEFWEQQKQLQELRKKEQLEALKKKDKHEQSAVASTEVKQKLQGSSASTSTGDQNWNEVMDQSGTNSTSSQYNLDATTPKCDSDFPLRKTASEPNLLKVRIKQRVMERRCNPMTKRHDRFPSAFKKKLQLNNCSSCNSHSSSDSPPTICGDRCSPNSQHTNTTIKEEIEDYSYGELRRSSSHNSIGNNSLFSSPSMPNISLSAHHIANNDLSEAKMRAACTARLGMPLTGQMLTGTLPFYPSLPAIESEGPEHEDMPLDTISELHATPASHETQMGRGHKQCIRPLGRTQSSPLPLGHSLLANECTLYYPGQQLPPGVPAGLPGPPVAHLPHNNYPEDTVTDLSPSSAHYPKPNTTEHLSQQQRDLLLRTSAAAPPPPEEASGYSRSSHSIRPLTRALSSPVVHLGTPGNVAAIALRRRQSGCHTLTTGLAFDNQMLKHACICGNNANHPEHAGRLQSIWARLLETGLVNRCDRLRPRKATVQEIQSCHSEVHALLYGTNPLNRQKMDMSKLSALPVTNFVRLPCGGIGVDSDTTWNEIYTAPAARMAVGCVVDLAFKTAKGDIKNGFAIVRPPGHHAERSQAMGFCYFNSIAIAAKLLQKDLNVNKILIFDWDVHHGNGTQDIFYDDPRILFISIHRHDDGNFFPGTGSPTECGTGAGVGFNVNVAWSGGLSPPLGDAEYLAAFRSIVLPIAKEFSPDMVLVSAGFDASMGHMPQLGGYKVSPACYGYMTKELMQLANGKIVLTLEGGYDLPSICDSAEECVRVLLGDEPSSIAEEELSRVPCQNAIYTLQKVIAIQMLHWPCIEETSKMAVCSFNEAIKNEKEEKDTVSAMASLSMQQTSILGN
ncbi:Histone deacetylase 4 [Carabus blaptoides fortunei]